jgi:hypothetical protein
MAGKLTSKQQQAAAVFGPAVKKPEDPAVTRWRHQSIGPRLEAAILARWSGLAPDETVRRRDEILESRIVRALGALLTQASEHVRVGDREAARSVIRTAADKVGLLELALTACRDSLAEARAEIGYD